MAELNQKTQTQLNQIVTESHRHAILRFNDLICDIVDKRKKVDRSDWQRVAELYMEAVKNFPPCFLLSLLDELSMTIDPIIRISFCRHWNEDDSCSLGLDTTDCPGQCPGFQRGEAPWAGVCKEKPCRFQCKGFPECDQGGKPNA
jgi:hypothetical protein